MKGSHSYRTSFTVVFPCIFFDTSRNLNSLKKKYTLMGVHLAENDAAFATDVESRLFSLEVDWQPKFNIC